MDNSDNLEGEPSNPDFFVPDGFCDPPAGYVPRKFLDPVYGDKLSQEEVDIIRMSTSVYEEDEDGNWVNRKYTDEEIQDKFKSYKGVIDTRNGEFRPKKSNIPIIQTGPFEI